VDIDLGGSAGSLQLGRTQSRLAGGNTKSPSSPKVQRHGGAPQATDPDRALDVRLRGRRSEACSFGQLRVQLSRGHAKCAVGVLSHDCDRSDGLWIGRQLRG